MMNDNRETISYHEFVDVQQEEITREVNNLNNVISPMLMLARRLENNYITREDAACALRGLSVLINQKSQEIIQAILESEKLKRETPTGPGAIEVDDVTT